MYKVRWKRKAKAALAKLWGEAEDRNSVTVAAHLIDEMLRNKTVSLSFDLKHILVIRPLAVRYKIDNDDMKIIVVLLMSLPPYKKRPDSDA